MAIFAASKAANILCCATQNSARRMLAAVLNENTYT